MMQKYCEQKRATTIKVKEKKIIFQKLFASQLFFLSPSLFILQLFLCAAD